MDNDGTVFVRLVDFPTCTCGGMVMLNDDGTYSVYLNSRLSNDQIRRAYEHEKRHILRDDLYRDVDVSVLEREA